MRCIGLERQVAQFVDNQQLGLCIMRQPFLKAVLGSNENTSGLLRQFFPKGLDLSCLSQTALNDVARMMNHGPHKTLGWRAPAEAMVEELAVIKSTVVLQT
jgi:IS30 family transposase